MLPEKNCVEEIFCDFPQNEFPPNDLPQKVFPQNSVEAQKTITRAKQVSPRLLTLFVGHIG